MIGYGNRIQDRGRTVSSEKMTTQRYKELT